MTPKKLQKKPQKKSRKKAIAPKAATTSIGRIVRGPRADQIPAPKDPAAEKRRMEKVIELLHAEYPDAKCSLDYETPFQLLIATILSAQCTDERVNLTTPGLFAKYPNAEKMAHAKLADLEKIIQPTGFFRMKAKSLKEASQALLDRGGELPRTLEEMIKLRGVGRKTANVVLGNAFGIQSGVVVDTHVGRLSRRLGFTREQDPVKVERDLEILIERENWTLFPHLMIYHGRAICTARKALCEDCVISRICPKTGVSTAPAEGI